MKRSIVIILIVLLGLAGIALALYPEVSNYLAEKNGSYLIQELSAEVEQTDDEALKAELEKARAYNDSLTGSGIKDPFIPGTGIALPDNYTEILDFSNHTMGYIDIPSIDVHLPIYHGTADDILSKGVGHMDQTAFPVGGDGNHSVLTGHTGLTTAKLFTDIRELVEGDLFYISVAGETLAYKVDQIKIVLPDETSDLLPVPGRDYVTLLTCTPYAVNSHRLLVRGIRTEYTPEQQAEVQAALPTVISSADNSLLLYALATALIMIVIILIVLIATRRKPSKHSHRERGYQGGRYASRHDKGRRQ